VTAVTGAAAAAGDASAPRSGATVVDRTALAATAARRSGDTAFPASAASARASGADFSSAASVLVGAARFASGDTRTTARPRARSALHYALGDCDVREARGWAASECDADQQDAARGIAPAVIFFAWARFHRRHSQLRRREGVAVAPFPRFLHTTSAFVRLAADGRRRKTTMVTTTHGVARSEPLGARKRARNRAPAHCACARSSP